MGRLQRHSQACVCLETSATPASSARGATEARASIAIEKARAASRLHALTGEGRIARALTAPAMAIGSNPLRSTSKSARAPGVSGLEELTLFQRLGRTKCGLRSRFRFLRALSDWKWPPISGGKIPFPKLAEAAQGSASRQAAVAKSQLEYETALVNR